MVGTPGHHRCWDPVAKTHLESRCCAILIYNAWLTGVVGTGAWLTGVVGTGAWLTGVVGTGAGGASRCTAAVSTPHSATTATATAATARGPDGILHTAPGPACKVEGSVEATVSVHAQRNHQSVLPIRRSGWGWVGVGVL